MSGRAPTPGFRTYEGPGGWFVAWCRLDGRHGTPPDPSHRGARMTEGNAKNLAFRLNYPRMVRRPGWAWE